MTHALIAFLSALLIVMYWVICRRRSLIHREQAADLLVKFFADPEVPEKEKENAEFFYKLGTSWFFLPLMTVLAPPVLLFRMLSNAKEAPESAERAKITDAVMKMYLFRNPVVGAICLLVFSVVACITILLSLLANRLLVLPSPSRVYSATARTYHHPIKH